MVSPANSVPSCEIPIPRSSTGPAAVTDPTTDLGVEKSAAETGIVINAVVRVSATATILLKSQLNMGVPPQANKYQLITASSATAKKGIPHLNKMPQLF